MAEQMEQRATGVPVTGLLAKVGDSAKLADRKESGGASRSGNHGGAGRARSKGGKESHEWGLRNP